MGTTITYWLIYIDWVGHSIEEFEFIQELDDQFVIGLTRWAFITTAQCYLRKKTCTSAQQKQKLLISTSKNYIRNRQNVPKTHIIIEKKNLIQGAKIAYLKTRKESTIYIENIEM